MFRLLSYNIYFGKKLHAILEWLTKVEQKNKAFDIICFQEFPYEKIDWFMLSRKSTSDYRFAPSFYLKKKIYGQLTIFNKNSLALRSDTSISLGMSRIEKRVSQLFRRSTKRTSLLTSFETNARKKFTIANTHLSSIALNGHRINQLKKICVATQKVVHALIVGDLNYTSALPRFALKRLIKKYQFEDATRKLKTHRLLFMKHQLDYIFAKAIQITHVSVRQIPFSDHYPLIAQFEIL